MSDGKTINVSMEMLRKLGPAAAAAGIELPEIATMAPTINVTLPIRQLALDLGQLVSQRNIFLKSDVVVTVNDKTGEVKPMTARRFPSWAEEFCVFQAPGTTRRVRDSLSPDDAAQILDTDIFRSQLRPLEAVYGMRLPVWRKESGVPVLLEPGYDAESRIFTVETLPYEMDWDVDRALRFLNEDLAEYPWNWADDVKQDLMTNRSVAVVVAGILGTFCRPMFTPGTLRPMISILANQPGTGKSTLVAMMLAHVFGAAPTTKTPKDDDKMDSELETVARTKRPFVFFDDIGRGLFSNPLNRFITAPCHGGRVMGGNGEFFTEMQVTQVFATGNGIAISADLQRRSLVVELFLAGEVKGRTYKKTITPKYLAQAHVRANYLAACWALVRNYAEAIEGKDEATRSHLKPLESFEEWSHVIGQMVMLAGYSDPLTPAELVVGGTDDGDEMRTLLIKAATAVEDTKNAEQCHFDRSKLAAIARTHGLLETVVGTSGDMEASASKSFGRKLQPWRGRDLVDEKGRKFTFSHKREKRGAAYPLTFA